MQKNLKRILIIVMMILLVCSSLYLFFEKEDVNTARRVIGPCYSVEMSRATFTTDEKHVYVENKQVPQVDPKTLVLLAAISEKNPEIPYTMYLWRDKNNIYAHCGKIITEADYNTFEYLGEGNAGDKNNFYRLHTGGGYNVIPRKEERF